jgi:hypothetical protein
LKGEESQSYEALLLVQGYLLGRERN